MTSRLALAAAALPLAAGLALAAALQSGLAPNPILYLRADAGTLLLLAGAAIATAAAVALGVEAMTRQRENDALTRAGGEQADAHRRFIRRLDHEIKNPLTAIRAALANLGETCDEATLASLRTQVDRLARLSGDLRKITELEAQPLETEPVDMPGLLNELLQIARARPKGACARITLTLPEAPWPLPPVSGDRDLLFLALHNLLDNALKFSAAGDTIEIRALEDGAWVVVEVADTGPGIADQDIPHLGEELYRGSASMTFEGSGLGLALVRSIVARHRGTVAIRSRLGKGTVVTLRLPVSRQQAQP